jgi:hypothetical protein
MEIITKGNDITVIFDDGAKWLIDKEKLDKIGTEPKKDRILNPDFATITVADLPKLLFRDRAKLAKMPNISDEMINALANDESFFVRIVVANRANLTDELKEKFANDCDTHVRFATASRSDLPSDLIAKLITDKKPQVRCRIISHQKLTDEQIRYLKENDTDPQVQYLLENI